MRKTEFLVLFLVIVMVGLTTNCDNDNEGNEETPDIHLEKYGPETFDVNGVEFKMIKVRGGTFLMGATDIEEKSSGYSKPRHQVTLSDYYIGETEVTQDLWVEVMRDDPSYYISNSRPVECVTWSDCQSFIKELNILTGKRFRLPTEAEWEYAARGGSRTKGFNYSGSNEIGDVAWNMDNSSDITHEVRLKMPNELGIYDMSGNVWEWCDDWFGDYEKSAQINPKGPSSGSHKIVRGGSYFCDEETCCCPWYRAWLFPDKAYYNLGFRIAM